MRRPTFQSFRGWKGYGFVFALLAVLLLLTAGVRFWRVRAVRSDVEERRRAAARNALAYGVEQFDAMQAALLKRARTLAENPAVVRGLRQYDRTGEREALIEHVAALDLPRRAAVEVYDPTPRLLAWQSYSLPLGTAANAMRFLEAPQVVVAAEPGLRKALAAWWPVRGDEGRALGIVRVMQTVRFDAPVQNQYLHDYRLAEAWMQAAEAPLRISWGAERPAPSSEAAVHPLEGLESRVLGYLIAEWPAGEIVVERVAARYGDLMALWVTFLLFWAAAGLWRWYRYGGRSGEGDVHAGLRRRAGRFAVWAAAWIGVRYALTALHVPARWQQDMATMAPLFDPTHLASTLGGGLMRSTGALLVTAGFAFLLAVAFLDLAGHFRRRSRDLLDVQRDRFRRGGGRAPSTQAASWRERLRARSVPGVHPSPARFFAVIPATVGAVGLVVGAFALASRRTVVDSTLDYFARTGLLPEPLVLVVFCALLLLGTAALISTAGLAWAALWLLLRYWPGGWRQGLLIGSLALLFAGSAAATYLLLGLSAVIPWTAALAFVGVSITGAALGVARPQRGLELLSLRRLLTLILLLTVLLYPLLYQGMTALRRNRVSEAAASFGAGRDPRVVFSIEQALMEARREMDLARLPTGGIALDTWQRVDSLATDLLRGSLLSSLAAYRAHLVLFDTTGTALRKYTATDFGVEVTEDPAPPAIEFGLLRAMYAVQGEAIDAMVEQMTGGRSTARFQYVGLIPLASDGRAADEERQHAGWVMVRAEPQPPAMEVGTPFPRILLPESYYGDRYARLSLAAFRDGALVRSLGRDFGRYRLGETVRRALHRQEILWRVEQMGGRSYLTVYLRQGPSAGRGTAPRGTAPHITQSSTALVTAARVPAVVFFDHLYYMLRLAVAGLFLGIPLYLTGLLLRWRRGQLPAPRVRFQDKMQDAFLVVGLVAVTAVGLVGLQVLTGESRRATQHWLHQHLEQVEEILTLAAGADASAYRVIRRMGIDSLAARAGVDLNLYRGARLIASSRPRLAREHLINERLPAEAFQALYLDGFRFTTTREQVGRFSYMAGYLALTDAAGRPRYVLSAPTLPEQERIEEEQARTVAYFFGALLLLLVLIMGTAWLLARALSRPVARLRSGLEAVGKGQFARKLPVTTRDEVGELVATFNAMREQLAESRRKLAQQEREGAWREMARQVAHEIKNPLTPMKLSVQHLRRAFERLEPRAHASAEEAASGAGEATEAHDVERFAALFDRITATLIEQIDTLARIADEFSTFARLPRRVTEPLDLNEVIEGAAALMQEETETPIRLDLHDTPLVVEADQEELRRVYVNLIKNALQALSGMSGGCVKAATRPVGHPEAPTQGDGAAGAQAWAESTVTDNGPGIPADVREKIFEPNFSTKNSGTGLGLAIVKKSVEAMGGEITFETEEGQGTTFRIRLPLIE